MSDPPAPQPSRRADVAAVLALAALVAIALANRFAFDTWLARFDMYTFFVPWYGHLGERLRAFDIPGWTPHLFSGTPFAGDPESGWMYLPAMLSFTLLPVLEAFKGMAAIHLAVASLGAYLLARTLGLRPGAALVAGLAYAMAPLLQWNSYCCLVLNQFAVWMPMLLLGIELALRRERWPDRIGPWALSALAVSQMFAGWIGQGWLLAGLLTAAWVGYRAVLDPPRPLGPLPRRLAVAVATGAAVLGFGLALGAAGWISRLDVNLQSNIPIGDYERHGAEGILNPPWTVPHLLAQVLGDAYERRSAAIGGATAVLALLALPLAGRRFAAPFFAVLAAGAMILTLADSPLHRVLYLVPGFRAFHDHDAWRVYAVAPLGLAMLAGIAVQAIPAWRGRKALAALAAAAFGLVALAAALIVPAEGFVGWRPVGAALLMALAVAAAALVPARRPVSPALLPAIAAALVFAQPVGVDLMSSWLGWPSQPSWERHWNPDPVVAERLASEVSGRDPGGAGEFLQARLAEGEPFRYVGYGGVLYPGDGLPANYMARRFEPGIHAILVNGRPMFLGLNETQGYNPLELGRYAEFMAALNGADQDYHTAYLLPSGVRSPMIDLLDVRYVVIDSAIPPDRDDVTALREGRREVFRNDLVSIWERDPAPRHAWIVHEARQVTREEAFAQLAAGAVDPWRVALVEQAPPELGQPPAGSAERATVTRYEPDEIEFATSSAAPGLLVVSEAYARGWRAWIDGRETAVVPVHGWLRAIELPAGDHVVVMRYDPLSLRAGIWISLVSAAVLLAGMAWARRRRGRA